MNKRLKLALLGLCVCTLTACAPKATEKEVQVSPPNRNFYEIFAGSFADSNDDGFGDLNGITEHLDYLNTGDKMSTTDLKVDGMWVTPIFSSDTYHRYDVKDYYSIDSELGTMADFETMMTAAKERGIAVILDLVVNHTSSDHPWFQHAKKSWDADATEEDKKYRDYYNWSDAPQEGYADAGNGHYYEAKFWEGMPDLNLENADVRQEFEKITQFWLDKGIAGFRLDAVGEYYSGDIARTNKVGQWLTSMIKQQKADAYIVGEVWLTGPLILDYYKTGVDSLFNFPFSQGASEGGGGIITEAVQFGRGLKFQEKLVEWQENIQKASAIAVDAPFLSNHDNNRSSSFFYTIEQKKMAAQVYLLMPGNPFIYYGEEIGMTGTGIDENKRLPMQWDAKGTDSPKAPEAATETAATEGGSVAEQLKNKNSLLNHYRQVLKIKSKYPEIASSKLKGYDVEDDHLSVTQYGDDLLIIHNMSDKDSANVQLPDELNDFGMKETLNAYPDADVTYEDGTLKMSPYTTMVLTR
jgi:alpha-amylase